MESIKRSFMVCVVLFFIVTVALSMMTGYIATIYFPQLYNRMIPASTLFYCIICLFSAATVFYRTKIKKPLHILETAVEKIRNHDLDFSAESEQRDELGQLCRAFEHMRIALVEQKRTMWRQIEDRRRVNAAFSHDIRTPLTIIKGYADILEEGDNLTDEEFQNAVKTIKKHLNKLERYADTMSSLHKIESRIVHPVPTETSILAQELEETAQWICRSRNVQLKFRSHLHENIIVVDISIVSQVLDNLTANSARHSSSVVDVLLELEEDKLILTVSDDGHGFSQGLLKEGIQPFSKGETGETGHSGIGLYISKTLCENHNGSLVLKNVEMGAEATAIFKISQNQINI